MDSIQLTVSKRLPEDKANSLRKGGQTPGVIYGSKMENTSIKCSTKDLRSVYGKAGESTLVEVHIDGHKVPSLIHAITFEPVSGAFEHVDLYAVDMTKKVTTHVPLVFAGESPAVKELGGILVKTHSTLTITCLPKDLPRNIQVDISSLKEFNNTILAGSIILPHGVELKDTPETVIAIVQEPRKEEVAEVVAPVEGAAAPGAEGAAAAAPAAGAAPAAKDAKDAKDKK